MNPFLKPYLAGAWCREHSLDWSGWIISVVPPSCCLEVWHALKNRCTMDPACSESGGKCHQPLTVASSDSWGTTNAFNSIISCNICQFFSFCQPKSYPLCEIKSYPLCEINCSYFWISFPWQGTESKKKPGELYSGTEQCKLRGEGDFCSEAAILSEFTE